MAATRAEGVAPTAESREAAQQARGTASLMWLVFLAGTGSMSVEISASRLLAPYFGSSTVVWANIIGLVLASLSLGYWIGGRLADRHPSRRLLGLLVLGASLLVAVVPFIARPLLDLSVGALDQIQSGAVIGSLIGSLLLFVPPVVLLGMVSPFAIRLAVAGVVGAGTVAGRIFALSTIGSLLGTFIPALLTIPLVGTQRTLLGSAALIALASVLVLGGRWLLLGLALAGLLVVPPGVVKAQPGLLTERESHYQFIQVVEHAGTRYLYLNEGQAAHSMWQEESVFTGRSWDMFLTLPALLGNTPRRMAVLGNAGGTIARAYAELFPSTRVDGVEIDPEVSDIGRDYFGLAKLANVRVIDADARPFLRSQSRQYDLIIIDAYRQPYVPFYLATREFFRLARERLRPGGAVVLNVSAWPGDHRLAEAVAGTMAHELPLVITWKPLRFNQLVVGLREPVPLKVVRDRLRSGGGEVAALARLFADSLRVAPPGDDPWTDDRAPVEWLTDRMILEFVAGGGESGERLLPTAPDAP